MNLLLRHQLAHAQRLHRLFQQLIAKNHREMLGKESRGSMPWFYFCKGSVINYKFFLSFVALFRLVEKLLSLVQFGVHQLLLQVFVLHHLVNLLGGFWEAGQTKWQNWN